MEQKIEDYLHLYLGCDVTDGEHVMKLLSVGIYGYTAANDEVKSQGMFHRVKPILRPLSSMTEEEKTTIGKMAGWYEGGVIFNEHHFEIKHDTFKEMAFDSLTRANEHDADRLGPKAYFEMMPYLLSRSFDLFGLIEAGLAISSTTIKP